MAQGRENGQAKRFILSLPQDEDGVVQEVRGLLRDSATVEWARDTAIQLYAMAGSGEWEIGSICFTQLILTAVEENPALFPIVDGDIELMVQRLERLGARYRATWEYVRKKMREQNPPSSSTQGSE